MIRLATIMTTFEAELLNQFGPRLLPGQRQALAAIKQCRSNLSPKMRVQCSDCDEQRFIPHSCGHRACPHCQHHECEQWLARQLERQVPARYFLLTFTLPAELRELVWSHQRLLYSALMQCAWETVRTFSQNDKQLRGTPGAIAVLHTHSRSLNYHPHVHLAVPAAAIDAHHRLWRTKSCSEKAPFLFSHKALAKVFRAKILQAISQAGLSLPKRHPEKWVVDCKSVGAGDKALIYLGRYLYRGVIREKDIIACEEGVVTFRYQNSQTRQFETRSLPGAQFLWLLLRHILPKGFRRARNFGFLHPNSKRMIQLLHHLFKFKPFSGTTLVSARPPITCRCCGGIMKIIQTQIRPILPRPSPPPGSGAMATMM